MTVYEYVKAMESDETLVRLWTRHKHGYGLISSFDQNKPTMIDDSCTRKQMINDEHWLSQYGECKVISSNEIAVPGFFEEATNLLIDVPENFKIK